MTDLHPCDEIAVRSDSSALTLNAKQMASARLQAELNKWLAQGNQINQAVGHCNKAQPFNNGHVLSEKAAKNANWKKFEITPEGKPKPERFVPEKVKAANPQFDRAIEKRRCILAYIRSNGACSVPQLAAALGYNRSTVDAHVRELIKTTALGYAQAAGKCRFFDLSERCNTNARVLMGGNHQRTRGEIARAHIIAFMQSQDRPVTVRQIAYNTDLAVQTANKHMNILLDDQRIRVAGAAFGGARVYEVVK